MARNNQYLKIVRRSIESLVPHNGQILSRAQILKLKTMPETLIKRGWAVKVGEGKFKISLPSDFVDVDTFVEQWEQEWVQSTKVSPWRKTNRLMYPKHNFKVVKIEG